jgi:hypothetical protein
MTDAAPGHQPSTLDAAAEQLGHALELLQHQLNDPRGAGQLLRLLGWELPPGVDDIGLAGLDFTEVLDGLANLSDVRASGTDEEIADAYVNLALAVGRSLAHLRDAAAGFAATPAYLARTNIVDEFFPRLLDLLVMQATGAVAPAAFSVGELCGIFLFEAHAADPANFQTMHLRHVVRWDRLGTLVTDPARLFREVYGWGTADFASDRLVINVGNVIQFAGVHSRTRRMSQRAEERVAGRPVPEATTEPALQLFVSLVKGLGIDLLDVGVSLFPMRPTTASGRDGGLGLAPYIRGTTQTRFPLAEDVSLIIDATVDIQGGVAMVFRPGQGMTVRTGFATLPSGSPVEGSNLLLSIAYEAEAGGRIALLRLPGAGSLEVAGLSAGAGVHAGEPTVELRLTGGRLTIDASEGDGFIASVLGDARVAADFDLAAAFAPGSGLRFHGSGALEIQIPVHARLGPIELHAVYVSARVSGSNIPLELSTSFSAQLGPVQATVHRLGLLATISFPDRPGNIGPAQLDVAFKPPSGIGLAIDLVGVSGGGALFADPDGGEYAGALELEFADFLELKAIGLITTRMPDGAQGFSLLVVFIAEFPGGLQLGYGFKLLAVGGLVGLGRTMRQQALIDGVRTGALQSVMFPRDIVANAPRILSDLRTFFPPEPDQFLIAPMAKLAWGTPTLITASVGVIIEIPGDIALIGVLTVALPSEQAPILLLRVNFAGFIDFDGQRLHLLAALFESRVLTMTIDGEMGLLARWGDDPNFVLTVGGFHPSFTPPPLPFPTPRRVSVDILNRSNARIRVSGYFAVTSNTAQFGAQAELYFKFSAFQVEGHVGFDALFRFSPFTFSVEVSASVALKAFGVGCFSISLRFALEGPTPWRAHGRGSVSLFFFDISADFDLTWGEERDTTLPPIDVMALLAAEFAKVEGWETRAPNTKSLVSLRRLPATDDLVLHPTGTLFVSQRAVPLDLTLDRVGGQRPRDVRRVSLELAGGGLIKRADTVEMFADAQFADMDDAAKLSRPAFERQHAGVELSVDGAALASARAVRRTARYEQIIFDAAFRRQSSRFTRYNTTLFNHLLAGNSISRSPLSRAQRDLTQPVAGGIRVTADSFTVAHTRDNTAAAPSFASAAAARDFLARRLADDPDVAGTLHVIPTAEARG